MLLLSNKALVKILSILLLSNLGQCSGSCFAKRSRISRTLSETERNSKGGRERGGGGGRRGEGRMRRRGRGGGEALRSFHYNQSVRQTGVERLGQSRMEHFNYPCLFWFPDVSKLNPNPSAETRRYSEKGTSTRSAIQSYLILRTLGLAWEWEQLKVSFDFY